ncbi:MAG TPA: cysteine desulfurase-like protein [Candidatus Eisenbacteria bacterium]|nr:cysteine desulfurase-like protein [Candidatus Eisenbacteria bacterium]
MTNFDVEALRRRFPALALADAGRPIAFFDGPGGTQVPASVISAVERYYRESNANHGGAFMTSRRSDALVEEAHSALGALLGVDGDEIALGANMTTLTFHVSRAIGAALEPGDEIVVTGLDHQANVDPWLKVAADRGLSIRYWEPRLEDCTLRLEDLDRVLSPRTRLVAFGWASNAVGTINPVAEVAARARALGAWTYVDAVHAAPHLALDARAVGADFVVCSAYKFFGPHIGALYVRREVLEALPTYKVRPAPHPLETGTGNFEGDAGALAAVDYLADVGVVNGGASRAATRRDRILAGMAAIRSYELDLYRHLVDGLDAIPGVRQFGITDRTSFDRRTPTAAITVEGMASAAVAARLGEAGIAVWDGDFYATGLIERLGLAPGGVVRIGLTHYNTAAEIDRLVTELTAIAGRAGTVGAAAGG